MDTDLTWDTADVKTCPHCMDTCFMMLVQKSKWISVKDRLPKFNSRVLVCDYTDYYPVIAEYDNNSNIDINNNWFSEFMEEKKITHWMPLPEPPNV